MLTLISREEDLAVAALPEDVDFFTSADVRAAGEELLDGGCRYLVLDTTPVDYIDSTGITVLLTFWQRLEAAGGALLVAVPDEHLRWRLRTLGLTGVMPVVPTLPEAVSRARRFRSMTRRPRREAAADLGIETA
ncbi:STAS domain-containing protein [Streptomyces sp. NPDC017943]|uniref:STAS domain-containing protein n=1 Tax=Streptomyces sp. NPDC017943 TaxID=3365019 RepID=UPI00379ACF05